MESLIDSFIEIFRQASRWSHIVFGFVGLIAFWFPVIARKGGGVHRKAGKVFLFCAYWVTASALLSCALVTWTVYRRDVVAQNLDGLASLAFLAYLAWVTLVSLPYSTGVLRTKKDPTALDTPLFRFLAASAIAASLLLALFAATVPTSWTILLICLTPLGLSTGWSMSRYMSGKAKSSREWFFEHMSSTLGAGIAFHTAFAVFGVSRIFQQFFSDLPAGNWLSFLPWVLPAMIGVPGAEIWKRHYRRKFGELPRKNVDKQAPYPASTVERPA